MAEIWIVSHNTVPKTRYGESGIRIGWKELDPGLTSFYQVRWAESSPTNTPGDQENQVKVEGGTSVVFRPTSPGFTYRFYVQACSNDPNPFGGAICTEWSPIVEVTASNDISIRDLIAARGTDPSKGLRAAANSSGTISLRSLSWETRY